MSEEIRSPQDDIVPAKRVLQFFWLTDWSGSMAGQKIATLNQAIREALPEIQKAVQNQSNIQIMMRAIRFADNAEWHIGPDPIPIEQFNWVDLSTDGYTSTAHAINLLIEELDIEKMPKRGLPPVAILVSDGYCTDPEGDYDGVIDKLNSIPWGKKSIRMALAVGKESEYDENELLKFINPSTPNIPLLKAQTVEQLIGYIKWASTVAVSQSSKSKSTTADKENFIGDIGPVPEITNSGDVF